MNILHTIIDRPGAHTHEATWRGRCTYCGHRAPRPDLPPDYPENQVRQTREQPWRIPSEIVMRFLAMRAGARDDVAWIEQAATQNPNQHPEDIHIIHGDLGYNYWYTNPNGYLTAGTHYPTQGKAWRAALLEQESEAAAHTDYEDYAN